jgi:hypothetical protein
MVGVPGEGIVAQCGVSRTDTSGAATAERLTLPLVPDTRARNAATDRAPWPMVYIRPVWPMEHRSGQLAPAGRG